MFYPIIYILTLIRTANMKKIYFTPLIFSLILLSVLLLSKTPSLSSDVILDNLPNHITMPHLYYSNISGSKIFSYTLHNNHLKPSHKKMVTFTEGILPQNKHTFYMNLLYDFVASQDTTLPAVFHDYYEDEKFIVISFSGDLSDIYIIEKASLRVHPLSYNGAFNLGPMYVSHVQVIGNHLIILAGEKESYTALIYDVYLPTFEVVDAVRLSTHPSALEDTHYTLTTSGTCVFINGSTLKAYDTLQDTYTLLPLDYIATAVINYDNGFIALGQSDELLHYTLFNIDNAPTRSGTLILPTANSLLVDVLPTEDYLYVISFDPNYRRYANYLTVYDFQTNSLVYSLGIKANLPYALLYTSFD